MIVPDDILIRLAKCYPGARFTYTKVVGDGSGHDQFRVRGATYFQYVALKGSVQPALVQKIGSYEVRATANVKNKNDWARTQRNKSDGNGYPVASTLKEQTSRLYQEMLSCLGTDHLASLAYSVLDFWR